LLTGSCSNPLATPLANVLYDDTKEACLKDWNAGLFAAPPLVILLFLGFVFVCLGVVTQFILLHWFLVHAGRDVAIQVKLYV
jgi:hypothetical protein